MEAVLTSTHNLCFWAVIRKIIYTPVNTTFTIWKWGLKGSKLYRYVFVMKTGVYRSIYNFLFLLKNIYFGYSLDLPRRGGSKEYPQCMFWAEIWKISEFLSENFQFLVVKFTIYLTWRVFVMIFTHIFTEVVNILDKLYRLGETRITFRYFLTRFHGNIQKRALICLRWRSLNIWAFNTSMLHDHQNTFSDINK